MDFFEHQEVARKKTGRLVVLFVLAVIAIVICVYLVVAVALSLGASRGWTGGHSAVSLMTRPGLIIGVTIGTITVIGGGSLFKLAQLQGGGRMIAESLGGQLVPPQTSDPPSRVLLNVVEEMAIAAGTPCPPVYLLENEVGINAFAAGYSPQDAVIGVTRGCAELLTRDELQGVIAHEFSHILNGDTRLNIRLIGVLHGILMIGLIGQVLLRTSLYSGGLHRSRKGSSGAPILAIGAGLAIVGFLGTFFGNWIKAAVSRQREFLADASAVQFTRNPAGIADALKRIGGFVHRADLTAPNAPEASHMFFGQAVRSGMHGLLATHPPLEMRIRRVEPKWDGTLLKSRSLPRTPANENDLKASLAEQRRTAMAALAASAAVTAIGQPTIVHVDRARELLDALPAALVEAAAEPWGARAVIYAILIDRDPEIRQMQMNLLTGAGDEGVGELVTRLLPECDRMSVEGRLPLIEKTISALRQLSPSQYKHFKATVESLVKADRKLALLEWTLQRILLHHLGPHFEGLTPPRVRYYGLNRLGTECATLISMLAHAGNRDESAARQAFAVGIARLGEVDLIFQPISACRLDTMDQIIETLASVAPALKRQLIEACAACISADHKITVSEAEIMRAVADSLGCPMPPLLPGQRLV